MEKNDNKNNPFEFHSGRKGISVSNASQNLDSFIKENSYASYLAEEAYKLYYCQFLWMYTKNFSEDFTSRLALNSPPLTLDTIQIMGALAILFGEDFAMQFWGKDFSSVDVQNALAEKYADSPVPGVDDARELTAELPQARERFDTDLEFLKCALEYVEEQRKDTKLFYDEYINDIKSSSQKYQDMSAEAAAATHKAEIQKLTDDLESCRKDLGRKTEEYEAAVKFREAAEKERDDAKKERDDAEKERDEAAKARDSAVNERDSALKKLDNFKKNQASGNRVETNHKESLFQKRRELKRQELLFSTLRNKDKAVYEVIADAYKKGLSYKGMKMLYDTNAPIGNLELMKTCLLRREFGIIDDEGEE